MAVEATGGLDFVRLATDCFTTLCLTLVNAQAEAKLPHIPQKYVVESRHSKSRGPRTDAFRGGLLPANFIDPLFFGGVARL